MTTASTASSSTRCIIVGAGPVGSLAALYAAQRGWEVHVYDLRADLRHASTTPLNFSRSINLALSERGINAIRHANSPGLLESVLDQTIPMYGRMIHGQDSRGHLTESSQAYDVHGRFQRAVDRSVLNHVLLDAIAAKPNVTLHFCHKLTGVDFRKRKAWFERRTVANERIDEVEVSFDLLLGCDGAHSRVRYHLAKFVRLNLEQTYIDTLWCEFTIPATSPGDEKGANTNPSASAKDGFATSPNHLHIWPSADMMFIAIPSLDRTFTCTLFAPSATFAHVEQNPSTLLSFFDHHFPGAAALIGSSNLQRQFTSNPHLPLISVKCTPYHFSSSGVILGDAAHAMVPFYGQGMNAGLEDVRLLFSHLSPDPNTDTPASRADALHKYTSSRVPDAHAINDLTLQNYWEMHAGVASWTYLLRKKVEEFLADRFPSSGFATQYARVSFTNQPYAAVVRDVAAQRRTLVLALWGAIGVPVGVGVGVWVFGRWGMGRGSGGGGGRGGLMGWLVQRIRDFSK